MAISLVSVKQCLAGTCLFVTFVGSNVPLLYLFCQKLARRKRPEEKEAKLRPVSRLDDCEH